MKSEYTKIEDMDDDFTEIDYMESEDDPNEKQILTIRTKHPLLDTDDQPELRIYHLPSANGLLVKVQPPREPLDANLVHVPCDIVLVIDVSGSMISEAPVPGDPGETKECYGLSVLDLTKHAARTIMETLNEHDRLGIVTFSDEAKVGDSLKQLMGRI